MKTLKWAAQVATLTLTLFCLIGCGGSPSYNDSMVASEGAGINMGEALAGLIARTQQTMSKVGDISSAEQAQPELHRISQDFDDLLYHVPRLSEQGRFDISKQARQFLPQMQDMASRVHEVPALYDVIGKDLDEIAEKLGQI